MAAHYLIRRFLLCSSIWLCCNTTLLAGSATWAENPVSGDGNTAANWLPQTVPNGPSDTAVFAASSITDITTSAIVEVDSIVFNADAAPFGVTAGVGTSLALSGTGVINNSQTAQSFSLQVTDETGSALFFFNSATAGESTVFNNPGSYIAFHDNSNAGTAIFTSTGAGVRPGDVIFWDNATAARATITADGFADTIFYDDTTAGSAIFGTKEGGFLIFSTNSSAEQATVQCSGGTLPGQGGGAVYFDSTATAAESYVTVDGAAVAGAVNAKATFSDSATAANSTFIINGGAASGAKGAVMYFYEESTADAAIITINGGSNGGEGARLLFFDQSDGGTATIGLFDNARMDIGNHVIPGVTIGSLEGNGSVFLGPKALVVGSNNVNTSFSGLIQDGGINHGTGGSLSKIGTGTLTLTGANTYTGGTTVSAGVLITSSRSGSATGTGSVNVQAGTLGGKGIISGAVTIGAGNGSGAFLAPSAGSNRPATLTLKKTLSFKADSAYTYKLNTKNGRGDEVIAKGVTIQSGAQFDFQAVANKKLTNGTAFTAISNTSANTISGSFINLPDNSTFTVGRNNYEVSYEGGDGNDLTLTVVP